MTWIQFLVETGSTFGGIFLSLFGIAFFIPPVKHHSRWLLIIALIFFSFPIFDSLSRVGREKANNAEQVSHKEDLGQSGARYDTMILSQQTNAPSIKSKQDLSAKPKSAPPKKRDTIINAPNSVFSINQQGGITAHTVHINTDVDTPRISFEKISEEILSDSLFIISYRMSIESRMIALPSMTMRVECPSIVDFVVRPENVPVFGSQSTNVVAGNGFVMKTIPNVKKQSIMEIMSKRPEGIRVFYEF